MKNIKSNVINELPCGFFRLDKDLSFIEINLKAIEWLKIENKIPTSISKLNFFQTNNEKYPIEKCIKQHFAQKNTDFSKSLVFKQKNGSDSLLFITIKKIKTKTDFEFTGILCDISNETNCLNIFPQTRHSILEINRKIVGKHEKITELHRLIGLAADSNTTVLISGESGTGKELVADAIHYSSERKNKPFVKVNCSALSETLLESELFGHVKGSFTGAYKDKIGKFELAHGGSIFLDEISEISPSLQVKLLRVIQEKTIEKVGDNKPVKVDMRIIAASNKNLRELIQKNEFREDLFYRLNVFPIHTIPLREHKIDIPLICNYFIDKFNQSTGKNIKGISKNAYRLLMDYCWPGNVRELENVIEHSFVVVTNNIIDIFDFPQELRIIAYKEGICKKEDDTHFVMMPSNNLNIGIQYKSKNGRVKLDKEALISFLERNNWNQSETAKNIGISRFALWKKLKKFGIKI